MNAQICEAFVAACEAACVDDPRPLKGRLSEVVRGGWRVFINGTDAPVAIPAEPNLMGMDDLPPKHMAAYWNGWLAGILNPYGGTLAAGEAANEDTFIAAMKEAKP